MLAALHPVRHLGKCEAGTCWLVPVGIGRPRSLSSAQQPRQHGALRIRPQRGRAATRRLGCTETPQQAHVYRPTGWPPGWSLCHQRYWHYPLNRRSKTPSWFPVPGWINDQLEHATTPRPHTLAHFPVCPKSPKRLSTSVRCGWVGFDPEITFRQHGHRSQPLTPDRLPK